MRGILIPPRHHREKTESGTFLDKFYKERNDDNELGSFYYRIYIEYPTDSYTELQKSFSVSKLLNTIFDKRSIFNPTFALWSMNWYNSVLQCTCLIQLSKPMSDKKMGGYMESLNEVSKELYWKMTSMSDSYEFIESILKIYKNKNSYIWNLTANGMRTEGEGEGEGECECKCEYGQESVSFYNSAHVQLNMSQQSLFHELIENEEWGQLLLW
jgi:hypothetical protein